MRIKRKRPSNIPSLHRRRHPGLPMPAEVDRAASPYADALTLEMPETDESSFVSELVRQIISQRASESRYPLGWPDQRGLDRVLARFARRRKRVRIAIGIMLGLVLALIAGIALIRAGSGRSILAMDGRPCWTAIIA